MVQIWAMTMIHSFAMSELQLKLERSTVIAPLNFMCIDILNNLVYRNKYINGM